MLTSYYQAPIVLHGAHNHYQDFMPASIQMGAASTPYKGPLNFAVATIAHDRAGLVNPTPRRLHATSQFCDRVDNRHI